MTSFNQGGKYEYKESKAENNVLCVYSIDKLSYIAELYIFLQPFLSKMYTSTYTQYIVAKLLCVLCRRKFWTFNCINEHWNILKMKARGAEKFLKACILRYIRCSFAKKTMKIIEIAWGHFKLIERNFRQSNFVFKGNLITITNTNGLCTKVLYDSLCAVTLLKCNFNIKKIFAHKWTCRCFRIMNDNLGSIYFETCTTHSLQQSILNSNCRGTLNTSHIQRGETWSSS